MLGGDWRAQRSHSAATGRVLIVCQVLRGDTKETGPEQERGVAIAIRLSCKTLAHGAEERQASSVRVAVRVASVAVRVAGRAAVRLPGLSSSAPGPTHLAGSRIYWQAAAVDHAQATRFCLPLLPATQYCVTP
jgi:hypothetical protein